MQNKEYCSLLTHNLLKIFREECIKCIVYYSFRSSCICMLLPFNELQPSTHPSRAIFLVPNNKKLSLQEENQLSCWEQIQIQAKFFLFLPWKCLVLYGIWSHSDSLEAQKVCICLIKWKKYWAILNNWDSCGHTRSWLCITSTQVICTTPKTSLGVCIHVCIHSYSENQAWLVWL